MRSVSLAIGLVILLVAALSYAALADNDSRERGNPDDAYNALPPTRQMESIAPSQKGGRDNPLRDQGTNQAPSENEPAETEAPLAEAAGFWRWPFDNDDPYYDRSRRLDRR